MSDFKSEYKRAMDGLEPDGKLLEALKNFPSRQNFFVRYRWVFGTAACVAVVLAAGMFLTVGNREERLYSGGASDYSFEAANFNVGNDEDGGVADDIYKADDPETAVLGIAEAERGLNELKELKPLSDKEFEELMRLWQERGLTLADFEGLDYVVEGNCVVLRYDGKEVVAEIEEESVVVFRVDR